MITLQEVFQYTPYDNRFHTDYKITKEDFIRDMFELLDMYHDLKNRLISTVNPESDYFRSFYVLSSYSGNGKTTFLYWFKSEIEKEGYWMNIVNLIEKGRGIEESDEPLKKAISKTLMHFILDSELLTLFVRNEQLFSSTFNLDFRRKLSSLFYNKNKTADDVEEMLQALNFRQQLVLYVLGYILQFKNNDELRNKNSYIFCFDNLDEISMEYLSNQFWEDVAHASSVVNSLVEDLNIKIRSNTEPETLFNFKRKIIFIIVLREVNISCKMAEFNDRIKAVSGEYRFILGNSAKKIIQKRIDFAKNNEKVNKSNKMLLDIIHIINNDDNISNKILMPLFNYDYRKMFHMFFEITDPFKYQTRLLNIGKELYDSIPDEYTYGKRGIIMNSIIKYYAHENYFNDLSFKQVEDDEEGHCNQARMMLTVFSNLSYPNGYPQNQSELDEKRPEAFSIWDAWKECKIFVDEKNFFRIISNFINIGQGSYGHLISLFNKEPIINGYSYSFNFDEEIEYLKLMNQGSNYKINNLNIEDKLRKITITLNAAGYIYLRYLLTHFEYLSAYQPNGNKTKPPLFLATSIDIADLKWEFQNIIQEVYGIVKVMNNNIWRYFNNRFSMIGIDPKEYVKSPYVFNGVNNRIFYISRLLTTHIEYLDNFRRYLYSEAGQNVINQALSECEISANVKLDTKEKINDYLIGYIEKYINLLDVKDPGIVSIKKDLEYTLAKAREYPAVEIKARSY